MLIKKKIILVFVLMTSIFVFSSCKKDPEEEIILESTSINILVENIKDFDYLSEITLAYKDIQPKIEINIMKTEDFYNSLEHANEDSVDLVFYKPYTKKYDYIINSIGLSDLSFNESEESPIDIFPNQNIKNMVNQEGIINVFPVLGDVHGIILNKKLFNEYNLNTPSSIDDLTYIANKIKEYQKYPFQFYLTPSEKFLDLHLSLMGVSDTSLYNFLNGISKEGANSKSVEIQNYSNLVNIIFDNVDHSLINFEYEQGLNDFTADRSFMLPGSCQDLLTLLYINPEMELDIIPFPSANNSLPVEVLRGFSVLENSKNKKVAMDFINFFNNPDTGNFYVNKTGSISLLHNSKTKIKEFDSISEKVFTSNPFINLNPSLDDVFRIQLRDITLRYINQRNVISLTEELDRTFSEK